ncbi:MAG TPA: hypothetical protein VN381_08725, partial [Anaerovoracaceae bacterium]|nr:hypothetical protein [Anaerovoracaceae bacterium]
LIRRLKNPKRRFTPSQNGVLYSRVHFVKKLVKKEILVYNIWWFVNKFLERKYRMREDRGDEKE